MAVWPSDDRAYDEYLIRGGPGPSQAPPITECFYCAGPFTKVPFVYWRGEPGFLALHPACFVELFIRLARDVHQVELAVGYVTESA